MVNTAAPPGTSPPSRKVRLAIAGFVMVLLFAAIAAILWRGPAILLDLSGYAQALWCF